MLANAKDMMFMFLIMWILYPFFSENEFVKFAGDADKWQGDYKIDGYGGTFDDRMERFIHENRIGEE